jgi:hypothetical protein
MKYFLIDIEKQCIVKAYETYDDVFHDWGVITRGQDKTTYVICSEEDLVNIALKKLGEKYKDNSVNVK